MQRNRAIDRDYSYLPASPTPPIGVPFERPLATGSAQVNGNLYAGGYGGAAGARKMWVSDPQKYGLTTCIPISLGVASQLVLAKPDTQRCLLILQNPKVNTGNLWVNFGAEAAVGNGIELGPGFALYQDAFVSQDDMYAVFDAAGQTLILTYSNSIPFGGN